MSSSEDSDIDIQCYRIAKPKKLVAKFINSLFIQPNISQKSQESKDRTKKTKNQSFNDDKISGSIPSSKFARRMPIALAMHQSHCPQKFKSKNIKFQLQETQQFSQINETQSCIHSSGNKNTKISQKLKYLEDEDKCQETVQLFAQMRKNSIKFERIGRKNSEQNKEYEDNGQKSGRYQQKTTPIFTMGRQRTQIIKEYVKDGNKIRTNWHKGLINGYTQIDYKDGGRFRGIFQQGNIASGQMTFPNGFIYTGQFSMFTFHGGGKLKFPSGQIFQGTWILGSLHGNGKISYPKGQIYFGQIAHFKRDGQGYLYLQNGHKYVGQFLKGQITGFGEFYKQGIMVHKGYWVQGKFIGMNEQIYKRKKNEMQESKVKYKQKQKQKQKQRKKDNKVNEQVNQSLKYLKSKQSLKNLKCDEVSPSYMRLKERLQKRYEQKQNVFNQQININEYSTQLFGTDSKEFQHRSSPHLRINKKISLSLKII